MAGVAMGAEFYILVPLERLTKPAFTWRTKNRALGWARVRWVHAE